ncbi:MAG: HTTM domain-containing protein [Prosthecobacter sp.]|nr:HTTM domain-containing protein [Prosthecobacter sp.]
MTRAAPPFGFLGRLFLGTEDERVYAAVRIGFSIASLINLVLLWPLRETLFSTAGTLDLEAAVEHSEMATVLLFHGFQTPGGVTLLMGLAAVAMLLLLAGILPRLAAAAVFLWHLSFIERAPVALTGWDLVLRCFAFLVLVSPMGRCWTLPAWWRGSLLEPTQVARYGLVLMRLQVVVIYFQTVVSKVTNINPYWRNGEFLPYFLLSHFARWPGAWAAEHADILRLGTYLALAIEAAIPILLFVRRTRYWGALLGLLFHGLICLVSRNIEPFLIVMLMSYLAFLTGRDVDRVQKHLCPGVQRQA